MQLIVSFDIFFDIFFIFFKKCNQAEPLICGTAEPCFNLSYTDLRVLKNFFRELIVSKSLNTLDSSLGSTARLKLSCQKFRVSFFPLPVTNADSYLVTETETSTENAASLFSKDCHNLSI